MPVIQFIKKKIQHTYLVWLQKSNKYIQLEEPAWFVFRKTVKRHKTETIAGECADRYGITPEESLQFVSDIRSGINQMNQPTACLPENGSYPEEMADKAFEPFSVRHYRFGEKVIEFIFETRLFEYYLHPLISHLETKEAAIKTAVFELFACQEQIVLRMNGQVEGAWTNEETHLVKGLIFMKLINVMHNKTDDFWLMTVHASAVSNGRKTILFPAAPGSGKTTIAALLQDLGFKLVSDDFVPIDRYSFCAWPFPIAMSVKQGSINVLSAMYPDLEQNPTTQISAEKTVRYLRPEADSNFFGEPLPVNEFVFVKYNQSAGMEWEKLDQVKAVQKLLDQSWISPAEGVPPILFDRLANWSFYQLTYSDNQKALDAIVKLFDYDQ